jgi:Rap1a immunity proteins
VGGVVLVDPRRVGHTVEEMKNALIVLIVVINAGLGLFVYYQESSGPPATPFYSLQGESEREVSTGNDVQIWCESERLTAQAYTARVWRETAQTDFTPRSQKGHSGVVDAAASLESESLVGHCEPAGLTIREVTDAYCKFLQDNPEKRSAPGVSLFTEAMRGAWPCDRR